MRILNSILHVLTIWLLLVTFSYSQQPQTGSPNPQSLQGLNAKWANGVGPGYWPYQSTAQSCTGLNICISPGTVPQCMGSSHVTYAGTTSFALTNNATNYVYLDLDNSCVPAVNTTGYSNRNIAIAKIVTSSGAVTTLSDDRSWNSSQVVIGQVNAQTGTTYTVANTDRNKLLTLSNGSAIAVTLPTTLGATFTVAVQNLGAGTATFTPSSGTVNGSASIALVGGTGTTGSGGWLFFDGTNWEGVFGIPTPSIIRGISLTIGDPSALSALTVAATTTDYVTVPFGCTLTAYNLVIDQGTITVKFWKIGTGTAIPTSGNSINTSGVGISSGTAIHSTTLSDFTTSTFTANDILAMNVTAVASAKFVNGVLACQ